MYMNYLQNAGITEQIQTTRFTEKLLGSFPNLYSKIVNKKTVVLFLDTVSSLIDDCVDSPDEFFSSLRKVVTPIRSEILKKKNQFSGKFDSLCQINSVPRTLLPLTKALLDGNGGYEDVFSQESLTAAQIIISHVRKEPKYNLITCRLHDGTVMTMRLHYFFVPV